jgi:hypothetical protein
LLARPVKGAIMIRRRFISLLVAFPLLAAASRLASAADKPIERFEAFAVSLGTGRANVIEIGITRWSTDAERDSLLTALQEFGQDKLLDALMKIRPPVGYVRRSGSVGWDMYYARNHVMPDGSRRVVCATNRPVNFREAANNTRSMQYQFTVIEMHLGANGEGEGKIVPAAKVTWDHEAKRLEIENYNALPVDLTKVVSKAP